LKHTGAHWSTIGAVLKHNEARLKHNRSTGGEGSGREWDYSFPSVAARPSLARVRLGSNWEAFWKAARASL